jgi:hypothetical protein
MLLKVFKYWDKCPVARRLPIVIFLDITQITPSLAGGLIKYLEAISDHKVDVRKMK